MKKKNYFLFLGFGETTQLLSKAILCSLEKEKTRFDHQKTNFCF